MIAKISHLTLLVANQDEALDFYTQKVGFKLHTDALFGPLRWLTLHPEGQPDFELVIMLAETENEKALVGKQAAGKPFFTLETTDCKKEYATLKSRGVKMLEEVKEEPWGISTSFEDVCGNIIYMVQPR